MYFTKICGLFCQEVQMIQYNIITKLTIPSTSVCALVRLPFIEIVLFFHTESPEQLYSKGPGICRFSEIV